MSTAMTMPWTRLVVAYKAAQACVIKYEKSTSRVFLIIVSTVFKLSETKCSLLWIAITSQLKENIAWAISYTCFYVLQNGGHGRIGRLAAHHVAVDPQEELDIAALEIEQIVMVKLHKPYPATKKTVHVRIFLKFTWKPILSYEYDSNNIFIVIWFPYSKTYLGPFALNK